MNPLPPPLAAALAAELDRQQRLWGIQHHPCGTAAAYRWAARLARWMCDRAASHGRKTWRHILIEEVLEALAEHHDPTARRTELVQCLAVIVNWLRDLDTTAENSPPVRGDDRPLPACLPNDVAGR